MPAGPFDVRRFTTSSRPDAFEVFDTRTSETASLPGRKRECVREADRLNIRALEPVAGLEHCQSCDHIVTPAFQGWLDRYAEESEQSH